MKKGILIAAFFAVVAALGTVVGYDQYKASKFGDVQVTDIKLNGNDILDSAGTTRITVGASNLITGNLTPSGTTFITITGSTAPRDTSSTVGITPAGTGAFVFNYTGKELCFSTGSTRFTWVRVSTPSVACSN